MSHGLTSQCYRRTSRAPQKSFPAWPHWPKSESVGYNVHSRFDRDFVHRPARQPAQKRGPASDRHRLGVRQEVQVQEPGTRRKNPQRRLVGFCVAFELSDSNSSKKMFLQFLVLRQSSVGSGSKKAAIAGLIPRVNFLSLYTDFPLRFLQRPQPGHLALLGLSMYSLLRFLLSFSALPNR